MIPLDLMDPTVNFYFQEVTVFGIPMIFTDFRIDRKTVPKGLYAYDLMHGDNDTRFGVGPVKLAPFVLENHLGTVLSKKPVKFPSPENQNLYFNHASEEWDWFGPSTTLEQYLEGQKSAENN